MSIFDHYLPQIIALSKPCTEKFSEDLQKIFKKIDELEEECSNARGNLRDRNQKDKYVMESILEDEDGTSKETEKAPERKLSNKSNADTAGRSSTESNSEQSHRTSKKRNKNEVDGILSPEVEKRQKRNASVKAQTNIAKQVNVNLMQKLRREDSTERKEKTQASRKGKLRNEENKENSEPVQIIKIKQEKISLQAESVEVELAPVSVEVTAPELVKQEFNEDEIAMPPPPAPIPKPRRGIPKYKSTEDDTSEEEPVKTRSGRTKKQKESVIMPPPATVPSSRALRASSRASKQIEDTEEPPAPEPRPKRTRAKKKVTDSMNVETTKESQSSQDSGIASPAEKPRPKRTRRAAKAAETKPQEPEEIPTCVMPEEIRLTEQLIKSPVLVPSEKGMPKKKLVQDAKEVENIESKEIITPVKGISEKNVILDETRVIPQQDVDAVVTSQEMDQTRVLPTAVYDHEQVTPKPISVMNETMVIRKCDETVVLDSGDKLVMNATVVIDKEPNHINVTDDNSIMTDDSDSLTPPKQNIPPPQPLSAVKEKVQKFEEIASRMTRTKTKAMAKKEEQPQEEYQTPPDKIVKQILPMETLQKMNAMIFNGKATTASTSASKPRVNGLNTTKQQIPLSTSKLSLVKRAREAAEETILKEKEDARKKKEAMLEAKKEQQKRKREEKMAAAAAARDAAQRERMEALEAAQRERRDRQAHADLGKREKLKELERKKQELARKVAVTEERRRAEEQARKQRLEEEQKRAEALRKKQLEESEALKREAAIMTKEIEKRQKEYKEKQRLKQRLDEKMMTPLKTGGHHMEPVRMEDGFQYLNSDEEDDSDHCSKMPPPIWCMSKYRKVQLCMQAYVRSELVDRLFSVQVHSPDLAEIFPGIDRVQLKRTSSAVWRTPPGLQHASTHLHGLHHHTHGNGLTD